MLSNALSFTWKSCPGVAEGGVCVAKVIHLCAVFIVCNLGYLNFSVIQMEPPMHLEMKESCKHLGS